MYCVVVQGRSYVMCREVRATYNDAKAKYSLVTFSKVKQIIIFLTKRRRKTYERNESKINFYQSDSWFGKF